MTKTMSVLFVVTVLMSAVLVTSFGMQQADALKAKGTGLTKNAKGYGSGFGAKVCGDKLCTVGQKPTPPKIEPRADKVGEDQIACTMDYSPVCGADGITYGNMCMMEAAGVTMAHKGECWVSGPGEPVAKQPMRKPIMHKSLTSSATITSTQDPAPGHESHQLAIILPPSEMIYKGSLTYSASEPIQLVVLHGPLAEGEDNGQPTWTPDGETKFALTFVDPQTSSGTWNFAGNALAVHTKNPEPFTVTYTVVASQ